MTILPEATRKRYDAILQKSKVNAQRATLNKEDFVRLKTYAIFKALKKQKYVRN